MSFSEILHISEAISSAENGTKRADKNFIEPVQDFALLACVRNEREGPQMLDIWGVSGRLTTHDGKPRIDITSPDNIITFNDHAAAMSDAQDAADNIPRR